MGEIPQDAARIFSGSCRTVAEDLIAAELDHGAVHIDEDGGINRSDDVDPVELCQGKTGAIEIAAVERENIEDLIGAGEVELPKDDLTGAVGHQGAPKSGGAF